MKRIFIFFLLHVCCSSTLSANATDSLLVELGKANSDSARLDIYNYLIKANVWNYTDQALRYAEIYDSIAQTTGNEFFLGKGKNFRGMCHYVKGETDIAVDKYFEAIRHFEIAKDSLFIGILYNNIGACFQYREKYEETISYYEKALEYFYQVNNENWINRVQVNLAIQYNKVENFDKSLEYNFKALEYFKKQGDRNMEGTIMMNIGSAYIHGKRYKECIEISEKALDYIDIEQDYTLVLNVKNNLAVSYLYLKKPYKAKPYIDEALVIARKYKRMESERNALSSLSEFYEQTGDYKKALGLYKEYEKVKNKFFNEEKDAALVEASTKYDSEKKEQEIKLLNTQNENQELRLAESRRKSIFYILGLIGLAVLAGLLFYAFRLKQKALSEKELLLKEIHHRVKNNLQIVTSLLNIQERRISDQEAVAAIKESKTRVESMALIHQSLYQNNDLSNVNAKDYVQQLMDYIFRTYKINQDKITYELNVQQLSIDLDTLIPLGLIINELVSNALKHAFNNADSGLIKVSMNKNSGKVFLNISDNGKGIPEDDVLKDSNSFGFRMIKAFVKKLNASLDIVRTEGTHMKIAFEN